MRDLAAVEGGKERVIVNQWAAARIEDESTFGEQCERSGVQGVFGFRRERQQQNKDIGP